MDKRKESRMVKNKLEVSPLGKTWLLDLDGTIVKHNGYLIDGRDSLLPGAKEFFDGISEEDKVIILTARGSEYREMTESFLTEAGIRFDIILYDMPHGERVLINDKKASGLKTAIAVNTERDQFCQAEFVVNEEL